MQKLHLVGFTEEFDGLIFSVRKGARSGNFVVPIDAALLQQIQEAERRRNGSLVRGEASGSPRTVRPESSLTPREMQDRIRAGWTLEEVAAEAGVDLDWVSRFAAPVLAEVRRVVERARAVVYDKPRFGLSALPLGPSVRRNVLDRGVHLLDEELDDCWSAYHLDGDLWVVRFAYISRGRAQEAEWLFDLTAGELASRNRLGAQLGHVTSARGRRPASSAVPKPARPAPKAIRPGAARPSTRVSAPAKPAAQKKAASKKATPKKPAAAKKKAAPAKRATPKKKASTPAKSAAAKKKAAPTKQAAPRKAAAPVAKVPARKAPPKKAAPATEAPPKQATARASSPKKKASAKQPPPKRAPAAETPATDEHVPWRPSAPSVETTQQSAPPRRAPAEPPVGPLPPPPPASVPEAVREAVAKPIGDDVEPPVPGAADVDPETGIARIDSRRTSRYVSAPPPRQPVFRGDVARAGDRAAEPPRPRRREPLRGR